MSKYLRKLLLIVGIRKLDIFSRGTPYMLNEILNNLLTPLGHPFTNPFTSKIINETKFVYPSPQLNLIVFEKPKPFNKLKVPGKGRIKRKILRKVVRFNRFVD